MQVLNIVLIEPEIPQNTGNIARTCSATGAVLHLVGPLGFEIDDKKLKRAGLDYWHELNIVYYNNIDDFFYKNISKNMYYFTTKAKNTYVDINYALLDEVYLIFGKETKGLPEDLLYNNYNNSVRLPMTGTARSLNLSNAVAVATYEVLRQWDFPLLQQEGSLTKY